MSSDWSDLLLSRSGRPVRSPEVRLRGVVLQSGQGEWPTAG